MMMTGTAADRLAPDRVLAHHAWLRHLVAVAAIAAITGIVVLSWSPSDSIARTGLPGTFEHAVAYWGAAVLAGLGAPPKRRRWLGLVFVALAGLLEIGQLWVPGRTPQLADFAAGSGGALLGLALAGARLGSSPTVSRTGPEIWSRVRHRVGIALVLAGVAVTPVWIAILLWFGLRLLAGILP